MGSSLEPGPARTGPEPGARPGAHIASGCHRARVLALTLLASVALSLRRPPSIDNAAAAAAAARPLPPLTVRGAALA